MKRSLILAILVAAATVVSSHAATLPVCIGGTMSDYTNANGTSNGYQCEVGDKVYSDFVYVTAGSDPDAAQVTVAVDNNIGLLQTGFQLSSAVQGLAWDTPGFSFSYTVTVDPVACADIYGLGDTCTITGAQGQFQGALAPNSAAMSDELTPGGTISLNDLTPGSNTGQINPLSPSGITTTNVVLDGTASGSSDPIDTFGFDIYETATPPSTVPEPATLNLIGAGLLGFGLLKCRRAARK